MNTSTVTPISENSKQPQQRQTAKDIIAANVKSLIEQLEAGHSDALTAYLDAMSRFHNYSFGKNILEIARQRPSATRDAGLYAWNQLGRKVKKGERGIRILALIVGIKRKKDEEANKDITKFEAEERSKRQKSGSSNGAGVQRQQEEYEAEQAHSEKIRKGPRRDFRAHPWKCSRNP